MAVEDDVDEILDEVDFQGWSIVVDPTVDLLTQLAGEAGIAELQSLGVGLESEDVYRSVNDRAVEWARDRGSELVGMRYDEAGGLVENPNPLYAITEGTREMIRGTVSDALINGLSATELAEELEDNEAFGAARALTIARTETANAVGNGSMEAAYEGGMDQKQWLASEGSCAECLDNDEAGWIDIDDPFPSGDDTVGAHPNCTCDVIYRRTPEEEKVFKEIVFDSTKHPRDSKGKFTESGTEPAEKTKPVTALKGSVIEYEDVAKQCREALPEGHWAKELPKEVDVKVGWKVTDEKTEQMRQFSFANQTIVPILMEANRRGDINKTYEVINKCNKDELATLSRQPSQETYRQYEALRDKNEGRQYSRTDASEAEQRQEAMKKLDTVDNKTVYRGVGFQTKLELDNFLRMYAKGNGIELTTLMSSSEKKNVAEWFAKGQVQGLGRTLWNYGVVFAIKTSKQSQCRDFQPVSTEESMTWAKERVFPSGTRFVSDSVEKTKASVGKNVETWTVKLHEL